MVASPSHGGFRPRTGSLPAGWGNDASPNPTVAIEPIEPILAGDIRIDLDPSGTSAALTVDTNIPVACCVIYGVDASLGSIAADNDMQGGNTGATELEISAGN
jgi:hypothetical protein